jgi:pimeloyl-ACP methyl ester carboxylesterase
VSIPQQVEVGGKRLEVAWHRGSSESVRRTLVFLHDGLGCITTWRDFPRLLAEACACDALVYSRMGHGHSASEASRRDLSFVERESETLQQLVHATLGQREVVLVGFSDGATICLAHAARALERPAAMVVIAPHVFCEDRMVAAISAAIADYPEGLRDRLAIHHADVDETFRNWSAPWLSAEARSWTLVPLLDKVRCPVLVVQGDDDPHGSMAHLELVEAHSSGGVTRLILSGVGHAPHRRAPGRVIAEIQQFLSALAEDDENSPSNATRS